MLPLHISENMYYGSETENKYQRPQFISTNPRCANKETVYKFSFLIGSGQFLHCLSSSDFVCRDTNNVRRCPSQNRIRKLYICLFCSLSYFPKRCRNIVVFSFQTNRFVFYQKKLSAKSAFIFGCNACVMAFASTALQFSTISSISFGVTSR